MATPVPYSGVPEAVPELRPTPSIGVSTPPAAFGTNIAEAIGHLGEVNQQTGQELFDRAYAMQDLQTHADVNARLADAQNQMTNKLVDYSQLEGKQAVDAYPDFQSDLNGIRSKVGQGLSPVGQSYYDAESRNSLFQMNKLGAYHAKDEQKRYIIAGADARIQAAQRQMQIDPNDPATAATAIATIRDQVAHKYADIGGLDAATVKQQQDDAVMGRRR